MISGIDVSAGSKVIGQINMEEFRGLSPRACSKYNLVALVVRNAPAKVGDVRDEGSVSGLGRSPGRGHGNPLQYSWLENPMDTGALWAAVHRVPKSRTQLQ